MSHFLLTVKLAHNLDLMTNRWRWTEIYNNYYDVHTQKIRFVKRVHSGKGNPLK